MKNLRYFTKHIYPALVIFCYFVHYLKSRVMKRCKTIYEGKTTAFCYVIFQVEKRAISPVKHYVVGSRL